MTVQNSPTRPLPTSRRTVLRAAAWSAPVVAVAAAAPAASASGTPALVPTQTGATVFAGESALVAVKLTSGGAPIAGQAIQFAISDGFATLSQTAAMTDASGVASISVIPKTATSTVSITATSGATSTSLTVVAKRPQVTITPTSGAVTTDVEFTLSGQGFLGQTSSGNAYGAGFYLTAWKASDWSDGNPLSFSYLAVKYAPAPGISSSGTFSGLKFTVPASVLTAGTDYAIAVSAAHQYSAQPQFNAHAIFSAQ